MRLKVIQTNHEVSLQFEPQVPSLKNHSALRHATEMLAATIVTYVHRLTGLKKKDVAHPSGDVST